LRPLSTQEPRAQHAEMAAQSCTIRIFAVKCMVLHFNALSNLWQYHQQSQKETYCRKLDFLGYVLLQTIISLTSTTVT